MPTAANSVTASRMANAEPLTANQSLPPLQLTVKSTTLSSPAHTTLLAFRVNSTDSVEIIRTSWNGGLPLTSTERWLPAAEAANYRAQLIHKGWTEF
jgi:hypothetical protein